MQISEDELVQLIYSTRRNGKSVKVNFGPHLCDLDEKAEGNKWAINEIFDIENDDE